MTITLIVGDNNHSLAKQAQKKNPTAFLIEFGNYKKFLTTDYTDDITVYTSFSDLPKLSSTDAVFFEVLKKADSIFYCPPLVWSDQSDTFNWNSNRVITEYFLYHVNLIKNNVQGLDLTPYYNSDYLRLINSRAHKEKQIWVAGCSIAHGAGVNPNEKFGILIADQLDLPVTHLTRGGTSIEWAKDQILRSDIRKNDIVVWGITQETRAPKAVNKTIFNETDPTILLDETSLYRAVTSVHQVVNFCRKISVQLILLPIICSEQLRMLICNLDEYCQTPYQTKNLDFGTDNQHPGPIQHRAYADVVCKKLLLE
jgi:hypothetical protein